MQTVKYPKDIEDWCKLVFEGGGYLPGEMVNRRQGEASLVIKSLNSDSAFL